jgi:hypothetical protein
MEDAVCVKKRTRVALVCPNTEEEPPPMPLGVSYEFQSDPVPRCWVCGAALVEGVVVTTVEIDGLEEDDAG